MSQPSNQSDKRRFIRLPQHDHCRFERLSYSSNKLFSSQMTKVVSKNISQAGMLFVCDTPPQLAEIILVKVNTLSDKQRREMKQIAFTYKNKILGKVVRIEETEVGYEVGVAFINRDEKLAKTLGHVIRQSRIRRFWKFFIGVFIVHGIVFSTISANILYLQYKETYQPDKKITLTPKSIGIAYEDILLRSQLDHKLINGWYVPVRNSKGVMIFCHGRNGNLSTELDRINFIHRLGFDVFVFDYRGYGNSEGFPYEQGIYADAQTAYDYLVKHRGIEPQKIIIVGESLGGAVAIDLALHRPSAALIVESTFVSLPAQAKVFYPSFPVEYILIERYDSLEKIKKIKTPLLIIHGKDDELVPIDFAHQLYNVANEPKKFIPFEGGHSDGVFKVSNEYKDQLKEFLEENKII